MRLTSCKCVETDIVALIYPLDLVSTRLQTQKKSADSYNNLLDALKRIINEEGFKAFYTGLGFDNAATYVPVDVT